MPSAGFEAATLAIKWLQTYVLDHTATGDRLNMVCNYRGKDK
jgi:hypothetical protein